MTILLRVVERQGIPKDSRLSKIRAKLGRPLREGCIAHHLNGVVDDDRPKNLMDMLGVEHPTLHAMQRKLMKESKREVVEWINKYYEGKCVLSSEEGKAKLKEWGIDG